MSFDWFFNLTDDELLEIWKVRNNYGTIDNTPGTIEHYKIGWKQGFVTLSGYLQDCDGDRTLMKLKYADDIAELHRAIHINDRFMRALDNEQ